jgi:hypothetical protein
MLRVIMTEFGLRGQFRSPGCVERSQFGYEGGVRNRYVVIGEPIEGGDHVGKDVDVEARVDLRGPRKQYVTGRAACGQRVLPGQASARP